MNRKNSIAQKLPWLRRGIQAACFIFLPSLFIQIWYSIKALLLFLLHGEGTLQSISSQLVLLIAASLIAIVAGRFFCGWMCSFGALQDFIYRVPRFFSKKRSRSFSGNADDFLKIIKYSILIFFIVFVWGLELLTIPQGTSPWDLYGMLVSFGNWPSLSTLFPAFLPAAVLLGGILAASFFIERFFCRYLCPLGAYFSLISRFRPFYISKEREQCNGCSLCTAKCSVGIPLKDMDEVHTGECIDCMECVRVCPRSNAQPVMSEESRNVLAAGTLSCAVIVGANYLGNFMDTVNAASAASTAVTVEQSSGTSVSGSSETESADPSVSDSSDEITADSSTTASGAYADGTYTGTGMGLRGETQVTVTVSGGAITDITVDSYQDDQQFFERAASTVIAEIIENQDTNVDAVSGATYSSNGIMEAVANALSQSDTSSDATVSDSTASASGSASGTDSASGSAAAADSSVSSAESNDTAASESNASANAQSSSGTLQDGTYTGTGTGLRGTTQVTVTVSGGAITDITVDSYQDDQQFFERAASTVIQEIIENQDVNVDVVSGATYSSNGIMEAVANALGQDFTATTTPAAGGHGHGGFR
jgi:uncharacterized protein with FMN-binding domain/polyferredoxin